MEAALDRGGGIVADHWQRPGQVGRLGLARHKAEVDRLWAEWRGDRRANSIFWDVIEEERNNILKTYTLGAQLAKDEDIYYVTYRGDKDAFEMFRKAVYWWRHQLMQVDARV